MNQLDLSQDGGDHINGTSEDYLFEVKAKVNYKGKGAGSLKIKRGGIIHVLSQSEDGATYFGEYKGTTGSFPAKYVEHTDPNQPTHIPTRRKSITEKLKSRKGGTIRVRKSVTTSDPIDLSSSPNTENGDILFSRPRSNTTAFNGTPKVLVNSAPNLRSKRKETRIQSQPASGLSMSHTGLPVSSDVIDNKSFEDSGVPYSSPLYRTTDSIIDDFIIPKKPRSPSASSRLVSLQNGRKSSLDDRNLVTRRLTSPPDIPLPKIPLSYTLPVPTRSPPSPPTSSSLKSDQLDQKSRGVNVPPKSLSLSLQKPPSFPPSITPYTSIDSIKPSYNTINNTNSKFSTLNNISPPMEKRNPPATSQGFVVPLLQLSLSKNLSSSDPSNQYDEDSTDPTSPSTQSKRQGWLTDRSYLKSGNCRSAPQHTSSDSLFTLLAQTNPNKDLKNPKPPPSTVSASSFLGKEKEKEKEKDDNTILIFGTPRVNRRNKDDKEKF